MQSGACSPRCTKTGKAENTLVHLHERQRRLSTARNNDTLYPPDNYTPGPLVATTGRCAA